MRKHEAASTRKPTVAATGSQSRGAAEENTQGWRVGERPLQREAMPASAATRGDRRARGRSRHT